MFPLPNKIASSWIGVIIISIFLFCISVPVITAKTNEEIYQEKLSELKPDDVNGHYQLGLWCRKNGLILEAYQEFEKVIKLEPKHAEAKKQLDSLVDPLVEKYIEADDPVILEKIKAHDTISPTEVKKWVNFIKTRLLKKPKCEGKEVFILHHPKYPIKYRVEGKTKGEKLSLLVLLHGGGQDPSANEESWQRISGRGFFGQSASKHFDLVAIPRCWDKEGAQWPWIQPSAVEYILAMIDEIKRSYNIDTNRIYLAGVSMGAEGTCQIGCAVADRFAALGMCAGGLIGGARLANLLNTSLTIHVGEKDTQHGASIIDRARKIKATMEELQGKYKDGYKFLYKEYPGMGHAVPGSAYQEIFAWIEEFKRDPVPHHIILEVSFDFPQRRYFYWLKIAQPAQGMRIEAQVQDKNRVVVTTKGVKEFTIFLNDKLVDLAQPVTVEVDGVVKYQEKVKSSLTAILESLVAKEDPEMVFTAHVDISQ